VSVRSEPAVGFCAAVGPVDVDRLPREDVERKAEAVERGQRDDLRARPDAGDAPARPLTTTTSITRTRAHVAASSDSMGESRRWRARRSDADAQAATPTMPPAVNVSRPDASDGACAYAPWPSRSAFRAADSSPPVNASA
jgi:hypothetical protein